MIEVSKAVWEAIATRGQFGETPDDVLRRVMELPEAEAGESYYARPLPVPVPGASDSGDSGGQDRLTGLAGYERGLSAAAKAAEYLGAEKAPGGTGNEFLLDGERVLLKWAKYRNSRIGVYVNHLDRVDAIVGVFEQADGSRELWKMPVEHMGEIGMQSVAHENQVQAHKKDVVRLGIKIGMIPADEIGPEEPVASLGESKYDGKYYRIGRTPERMATHNDVTWRRLAEHLEHKGKAHYRALVKLAEGHVSGTKSSPRPQSFIRYCIRSGWLKEA